MDDYTKLVYPNYKERVFNLIVNSFDKGQEEIINIVKRYSLNKKINISKTISKCFISEDKGIKNLMTSRIINYVTSMTEEKPHKCLEKLHNNLELARSEFLFLSTHYEKVFYVLFHSIIMDKD